jgi:drug/metabolite transporter (DMT)-like permease
MVWGGLVLGEHLPPELIGGFALVLVSLVLVLRLPIGRLSHVAGVGRRLRAPVYARG